MTDTQPHTSCLTTTAGDIIAAGFKVTRRLRTRGCSTVYRAQARDGSAVMVKTLCHQAASRQHARFNNEETALRLLRDCPHVPILHATGTVGSRRYLACDWHPGKSLRRIATGASYWSEAELATAFRQIALPVARAFCRLHSFGIAHGDVSRNNILVAAGMVSLIDLESAANLRTPAGRIGPLRRKCTWVYAPPEYAREHYGPGQAWRPTFAADQYSVAAVLYRQLTGHRHRASPSPSVARDARKTLDVPPRAITGWPARRWPGLPAVFARALSTRADERFGSLPEFTSALTTALSDEASRFS